MIMLQLLHPPLLELPHPHPPLHPQFVAAKSLTILFLQKLYTLHNMTERGMCYKSSLVFLALILYDTRKNSR